jgi:thioredoxin reductase (NADPH)
VHGRTVVIATGARYLRLRVPRLEEFEGVSIWYAATEMEAMLCRGDPVVVVGGGNSAGQATVFLSEHAASVRLVVREGDLGETMSRYLIDRIQQIDSVDVLLHTEVRELVGERGALQAVVAENNQTGERQRIDARALFIFIGAAPYTAWLRDQIALDEQGFVLTGHAAGAVPGHGDGAGLLETSRTGIFAVGDVRAGSTKRVASAVGEGAMAVVFVHRHLAGKSSHENASPRERQPTAEPAIGQQADAARAAQPA